MTLLIVKTIESMGGLLKKPFEILFELLLGKIPALQNVDGTALNL